MNLRMQFSMFWGGIFFILHLVYVFPFYAEGLRWLGYRLVDFGYGNLAYYVGYLEGDIGFWVTFVLQIVILFSLLHWANKPDKPNKKPSKYELPKPKV